MPPKPKKNKRGSAETDFIIAIAGNDKEHKLLPVSDTRYECEHGIFVEISDKDYDGQ